MEKSTGFVSSSSMNSNNDSSIGSEESGWTSYFEEAFSDVNGGQRSSFSFCSSSLLSDGASPSTEHSFNLPQKLNFYNKVKPRKIFYDDSLEDTASSPVSSPKVGDQRKSFYDHASSNLAERRSSEIRADGGI